MSGVRVERGLGTQVEHVLGSVRSVFDSSQKKDQPVVR